jgi:hypothetical protein
MKKQSSMTSPKGHKTSVTESNDFEMAEITEKELNLLKKIFYYSFIHMCIHCLGPFSPPTPSPPSSPPPSLPGRTCSALISNFVEEKA